MALETGTYVADLTAANPDGSDGKSQGDDHLRLIKSVLRATFPNASRAFRFPAVPAVKTSAYTIVVGDETALIRADVSSGAFTVTLPLGSAVFAGYRVAVMKSDSSLTDVTVDGNGTETINGALTRTLSSQYQVETYEWDGAEWKILNEFNTTDFVDANNILAGQVFG